MGGVRIDGGLLLSVLDRGSPFSKSMSNTISDIDASDWRWALILCPAFSSVGSETSASPCSSSWMCAFGVPKASPASNEVAVNNQYSELCGLKVDTYKGLPQHEEHQEKIEG